MNDARSLSPSIPPGPRRGWLPGRHALEFTRDPLRFLTHMARTYGDISMVQMGPRRLYLLNHPDFIHAVLVKDAAKFIKSEVLQRTRFILGNGLLTSEGELHAHQRRMIQPIFHANRIEHYAPMMVGAAARLSAQWQDGQVTDIHDQMTSLALDIAGRSLFSTDLADQTQVIARSVDVLLESFNRLFHPLTPLLVRLNTSGQRRVQQAIAALDQTIYTMIEARRTSTGEDDLLARLLAVQDADRPSPGSKGTPLDAARQTRDEALTLLLAGHETTANALTFAWYLLGCNPQVEERLHNELRRVLAGRPPTVADLEHLPYTRQVLAETMRLYPPAWTLGRQPLEDYSIGGYTIPRGAVVLMSQWVMHRDPRYYPDPEVFDPDRWLPEAQSSRPRFAYFPFGGGPRVCIGEGFAWMEASLALATLAQEWCVRPLATRPPELQPVITLRPRRGIPARLEKRR